MIVFVGALRHPHNCSSYERVEELLNATLASICEQTDQDFRVIIVCNRKPLVDCADLLKKVEFIEVAFPPPSPKHTAVTGRHAIRKDRSSKYVIGIIAAQAYKPQHIMIVDTDDYIAPYISEYVNARKDSRGWYVEQGYIMDHGSDRKLWAVKDFHQVCGTSLIVSNALLVSPNRSKRIKILDEAGKERTVETRHTSVQGLKINSSQEEIYDKLDNVFLQYILGAHKWAAAYFGLKQLPFPGAIWNWNTGENHGDRRHMSSEWKTIVIQKSIDNESWVNKYLPQNDFT